MKLTVAALRFALVGIVATLIHVVAAVTMIKEGQFHPALANGLAFILANLASYIANTCWSFNARIALINWGRFIAVSFAAWVLTVIITWAVETAGGHYMIGILMVITLVPALTFLAHWTFTYR